MLDAYYVLRVDENTHTNDVNLSGKYSSLKCEILIKQFKLKMNAVIEIAGKIRISKSIGCKLKMDTEMKTNGRKTWETRGFPYRVRKPLTIMIELHKYFLFIRRLTSRAQKFTSTMILIE